MKKTRLLAALLCVMMVLTAIPMFVAADEVTDGETVEATFATMKDVPNVGYDSAVSKRFDLTNNAYQSEAGFMNYNGLYNGSGSTVDPEKGLLVDSSVGGTGMFRWYGAAGWSPLAVDSSFLRFQMQLDNADENFIVYCQQPTANSAAFGGFEIGATAFKANTLSTQTFAREGGAGLGLVDYMIVPSSENTSNLYMNSEATGGKWVLACQAYGYAGSSSTAGIYMTGKGWVKEIEVHNKFESFASIKEIVGSDVVPYQEFNFTYPSASSRYVNGQLEGDIYSYLKTYKFDTENGMEINGTDWRYGKSQVPVLAENRVIYFRAKAKGTDTMTVYMKKMNTNVEYTVAIKADGVTSGGGTAITAFAPGNEFAEYLAVDTADGLKFYGKSADLYNGKWVQIMTVTTTAAISNQAGLYITGQGYVSDAVVYSTGATTYASVSDIVDADLATTYHFDFTTGFDEDLEGEGSVIKDKVTFDENGMNLAGNANWRFRHTANGGYSPISDDHVATFSAKVPDGDDYIEVLMKSPLDGTNKVYIVISYGNVTAYGTAAAAKNFAFEPGFDWADYMVKQNEIGGYDVYVKNADTFDKWALLTSTDSYNGDTMTVGTGFQFRGGAYVDNNTGSYVKDAKVLTTANVVEDAATIPEGATTLYFDDDFAADKGYDNVSMTSASVANGNLVLAPAGVGADGLYYAYNNEIPVGGYAEFKVKATGWSVQNFVGSDGLLSISAKGNDVKIGDTTAMIGDGGHVWRTWRVVRTAEGYTGYCKADDDAVWYKAFENVAPAATELSARVDFAKYYAGQTAEYDYLKIYGAAPVVDKVAITDGIGNTFVTVNDEGNADVTYTSMRAFVKKDEEPKTFVIAEYNKSNGVLTNLKIEEVEAIADDSDVISVTYLADEDSVVKVFLWDSLTGVSNLMDAITLNFAQ